MKLNKSEFNLLFSPESAPHGDSVKSVRHSNSEHIAAQESETLQVIRRACPTLWGKLNQRDLTKRELRQRMLELLHWLATKNELSFQAASRLVYSHEGGKVDGRVYARVCGDASACLELSFHIDSHALSKLKAATENGHAAVLLWAGKVISKRELLDKVAQVLGTNRLQWLNVVMLNSGTSQNQDSSDAG